MNRTYEKIRKKKYLLSFSSSPRASLLHVQEEVANARHFGRLRKLVFANEFTSDGDALLIQIKSAIVLGGLTSFELRRVLKELSA